MTKTLAELEQLATDCMESSNPGTVDRHKRAGDEARAAENCEHANARGFYRDSEARELLAAVELEEPELTTAERLLVAAMIAARANGEEFPARPTRLLVALEGGLISGLVADVPGVDVVCLDYDTEGAEEEDLFAIPQPDGKTSRAWRRLETAEVDPAFIDGARAARPSDPEARLAMLRREVAGAEARGDQGVWAWDIRRELEELEAAEKAEPFAYEATLARYDAGELNDEQAIAELQRNGWAERRAYTILEEHQAA